MLARLAIHGSRTSAGVKPGQAGLRGAVSRCGRLETASKMRNFSSYPSENTNITYSGGQASEGQGGFYGSGGARKISQPKPPSDDHHDRPEMLAMASDVERVVETIAELQALEDTLADDQEENDGQVSNRSIEIRGKIKHLVTNPEFMECLGRLEVMGEPVWGLSSEERDLVKFAREKVNLC